MTPEQRLKEIEKLVAQARATDVPPDCLKCCHARNYEYRSISECRSPVYQLQKRVNGEGFRSHRDFPTPEYARNRHGGLCGPEGLLFQRRTWQNLMFWRQPTSARQFLWGVPIIASIPFFWAPLIIGFMIQPFK